jgi:Carboxypeptidase regulatory-like domain
MRRLHAIVVLAVLFSFGLFAQTTSLTGTVSDPSGAVIPGASITISNIATGAVRDTTADAQGRYTIQQIAPGTYKLTAKVAAFSDVVIERVELLVSQPATVPIVFEKLGSTSTSIQVEAAAAQVNTTDASLGNAINSNAIVEMPMFARNVAGLLAFQPGVTSFGSFGASAGGVGAQDYRSGSVNGGHSDQGNITLDGADVNDQNGRTPFFTVLRVTLDSVEEFRTTTTNGDAATGRGSGADVVLVTKSGTNEFHGSLYEYRRGTETAANTFFNNQSGVPIAPLLVNVFGGSGGGAIKKNKLFYFINYEGRRDASANSADRTVPSLNLRQGIVGYTSNTGAVINLTPAQVTAADPAGIGANANALALMQKMPAPNNTTIGDGINTQGYLFNAPGQNVQNTYIAKFDYHLDDKNSLFIRGNLQNDWADNGSTNVPQFPGLPPNSVSLANSKGLATGWTDVVTPNLVSTFHYGLTRAGNQTTGVLTSDYEWFRGLSTPYGTSTGLTRIIPVHTFAEDVSWNHGAHDIRFGGVVRLISNESQSYSNSYSSASSNPSWLNGSGNDLQTALATPVSSGFQQNYEYAMAAVLGLESQGNADYNYLVNGKLLPVGAPVSRDFVNHEGEMYGQDTWKVTRNFTVTAGLRLQLEPPVYEANGQQASTNIPLGAWLGSRANYAEQGLSQQNAGLIDFLPLSQGTSMYPFHKDWAPRLGLAYSPQAESGISKFLFGGPGKTSIRAGAGMYYDLVGQPLAQAFASSTPGLSQSFSNPANLLNSSQVPRYTSFYTVPSAIVPAAPAGGLPLVYPYGAGQSGAFAITNSIDQQLAAPYTMNLDFSIGREFGHGFFIQGSYVGRLSRHTLINRDLAMPTDLVDPSSGQTYFQAMTQLMTDININNMNPNTVPNIPFFQDMWKGAAGNGLTATQVWANDYLNNSNVGDATNTLNNADNAANCVNGGPSTFKSNGNVNHIACGNAGPWMLFNPQFSALSAFSSIGIGDYHAMQWSVRKRYSYGLQFDVNYVWSKSIDLGSVGEAGTGAGGNFNPSGAAFSGFIQNTWNPSQMRAVSAYDTTQQVNAYGVYELPFGRGRQFGHNMSKILDAVVGGWQMSANYRQTSGLPFTVSDGSRWPTDWDVSANATPNGPIQVSETSNAIGIKGGGPNLFTNPLSIVTAPGAAPGVEGLFHETFAGQSGLRDNLRGNGLFNIDTGLYKVFTMPYSEHHKLQIRWEAYNVTNSVIFDPASTGSADNSSSNFGKISTTLTAPRQMQFAGRYTW